MCRRGLRRPGGGNGSAVLYQHRVLGGRPYDEDAEVEVPDEVMYVVTTAVDGIPDVTLESAEIEPCEGE